VYRPLLPEKRILDMKEIPINTILSTQLIPGDILVIEARQMLPCDCILLSGELLLNESSLTGESIPIPKFSLEHDSMQFSFQNEKRSCLFEGTKVMSSKPTDHG
jgi:cation-transporting P-type ATPase 13A2